MFIIPFGIAFMGLFSYVYGIYKSTNGSLQVNLLAVDMNLFSSCIWRKTLNCSLNCTAYYVSPW